MYYVSVAGSTVELTFPTMEQAQAFIEKSLEEGVLYVKIRYVGGAK